MPKVIKVDDIITMEEFAKEMGVSRDLIDDWRKRGMPIIRIGKYMRICRPHALDWIITQGEAFDKEDKEEALFNRKGRES